MVLFLFGWQRKDFGWHYLEHLMDFGIFLVLDFWYLRGFENLYR